MAWDSGWVWDARRDQAEEKVPAEAVCRPIVRHGFSPILPFPEEPAPPMQKQQELFQELDVVLQVVRQSSGAGGLGTAWVKVKQK